MTPTQKAKELVDKYDETLTYLESKSKAKQCALIAVDEILETEPSDLNERIYWRIVQEQINKL
jgi:hypothetical protein